MSASLPAVQGTRVLANKTKETVFVRQRWWKYTCIEFIALSAIIENEITIKLTLVRDHNSLRTIEPYHCNTCCPEALWHEWVKFSRRPLVTRYWVFVKLIPKMIRITCRRISSRQPRRAWMQESIWHKQWLLRNQFPYAGEDGFLTRDFWRTKEEFYGSTWMISVN